MRKDHRQYRRQSAIAATAVTVWEERRFPMLFVCHAAEGEDVPERIKKSYESSDSRELWSAFPYVD